MSIFRASHVRGIYPDEVNEAKAYRIGRAIATLLDSKTVVVGGDYRHSTLGLKTAIIDGLIASSCDAVDIGVISTPMLYFTQRRLSAGAGIMVTASHHAPTDNGFKIIFGDYPATEEQLSRIRSMVVTNGFFCQRGLLSLHNPLPDYEDFITSVGFDLFRYRSKLPKVVVDCGNGSCSGVAPRVFESLAVPTVGLFCEPDGSFPNRFPDITQRDLHALRKTVTEESAAMGVAFDGDGDRVAFVDDTGEMLSPDQVIAIIARYKANIKAGDKVVLDIMCSDSVLDVISELGAAPVIERSGYGFIRSRMASENASYGGDARGRIFHVELGGGDDALYTALVMTAIAAEHGPLSRLAAAVPRYALTPNLRIRSGQSPAMLDAIARAFPDDCVSSLDGVKVQFADGWGIAHISKLEPIVTLRFEGTDESALLRVMDEFLRPAPDLKQAVMKSLDAQSMARHGHMEI